MASNFDFNDMGMDAESPPPHSPAHTSQHQQQQQDGYAGNEAHPQHPSNITVYQTTGPNAYTEPIMSPNGSQPALNPRSCVTCRRRKVRCDKQMPCSNCRRGQIPCVFPAPGRARRQPRPKEPGAPHKHTTPREAELVKRLRKLEGMVEELSGQIDSEPGSRHPLDEFAESGATLDLPFGVARPSRSGAASASHGSQDGDALPDLGFEAKPMQGSAQYGRLVSNEQKGSSRYVSSGFWSKLNDELDAIRTETQALSMDDDDDSESDSSSPGDSSLPALEGSPFMFGYSSADVDMQAFFPPPHQANYLWQKYQENVEPLVKILHVPTTDVVMKDASHDTSKLSPANASLVFSIYYSAVVSLDDDEVTTNLTAPKQDLLTKYRFALEQSLARAKFLDTSDIAVMQAMSLFLIVVRRHDDSRFCWSMVGLLIRLAQGMGLHRDGSHFKLPPLDVEIRRRLWWATMSLDLRCAEEMGSDLAISDRMFDTQMPLNINDSDISADSTEAPPAREGRSDQAVALVRYEICQLSRQLLQAASAMSSLCPSQSGPTVAERERMLIDVYEKVEQKFFKHVVDEADPLYWVAAMIARIIMAKMCLVIYQQMLFPGTDGELTDDIRERIYVAAVEIIEYNHKLNTDPRCKQYQWLFLTYTSWHAIAYALVEICRRPWSALVERGWEAVNGYERNPVEVARNSNHTTVFLPLRKLFIRARRHRDTEVARLKADPAAARKLEFEERMNPAQARFGPVPGAEHRMEEVREQWKRLVRPNNLDTTSWAEHTRNSVSPIPGMESCTSDSGVGSNSGPESQPQPPISVTQPKDEPPQARDAAAAGQMDMTNDAMDFMGDFVMRSGEPNMSSLWYMDAQMNQPASNQAGLGQDASMGYPNQAPSHGDQTQLPKDDHVPPYLWPSAFSGGVSQGMGADMGIELDDGFSWNDWSESIRGLEMQSSTPSRGWGQAAPGQGSKF